MIELMCLKELMLTKPMVRAGVCIVFHYWYFPEINFRFPPKVCMIAAIYVKENGCRTHFLYVIKDEDINLLRKAYLTEKNETLYNIKIYYNV